jgi:hypothetical protein
MRVTAVFAFLLVLLFNAARAQNEDTRDLPSPSVAGRSSAPLESIAKRLPELQRLSQGSI